MLSLLAFVTFGKVVLLYEGTVYVKGKGTARLAALYVSARDDLKVVGGYHDAPWNSKTIIAILV